MGNLTGRMPTRGSMYPQIVEVSGDDPLTGYRISDRDSDGSDGYNYFGYLDANGGYYIMREQLSNGAYRYSKGAADYESAWTNRANQTYGYFSIVF